MDNTEYLKQLAETEKRNKNLELEQAKAEALKTIGQQEATTMPTFQAKRQQASVQSQLGAKNLAEFWANRGQTQQGISAQAEMSRQNTLGNTLSDIGQSENAQQQEFNQARDTAQTSYQNNMTNFNNQIDQELTTNLYNDKLAQQEAQAKAQQQDFENQLAVAKFNLSANKPTGSGRSGTTKTGILPLDKVGNYTNITIPYAIGKDKPIINAMQDLKNKTTTYQLNNGSKITVPLGTNPYTGTLNKDAVETAGSKTITKTFANGYQPNNIGGVAIKTVDSGTGTPVTLNNNGENVKVWTTGDKYYYWDSPTNSYKVVPSDIEKSAGLPKIQKGAFATIKK